MGTDRKRAIEVLEKGRDFATQLQILLQNPSGDHGSALAEDLGVKILRSFTDTLSVLLPSHDSAEACQIPTTTQLGSPSFGEQSSVDSGESSKRPAVKDRRGCYKRRKISDSWKKVSPSMEDGHSWRKYGQKAILNAKFPRNYYRCTHKHDQGCRATKQVQRIQEDPNMYQTTYFGHHTCRDTITLSVDASQHAISDSDPPLESYLLSFESNNPTDQSHHLSHPESKEGVQGDRLDNVVWPEELITGSRGLDMEFLMKSDDFDSFFHFDESEFY